MAWKKVPPENEELLERMIAGFPNVDKRKMFGCPVWFVNGNMFAGAHQESIFVRLSEDDQDELFKVDGVAPFEPMPGRVMREYVVIPPSMLESEAEFADWLARSKAYADALPAKTRRSRK